MKNPLNLTFGKKLRSYRVSKKYTQEKLAELTGLSPQHIQKLEGKAPSGVTLETAWKFSNAFNISLSEFLKGV